MSSTSAVFKLSAADDPKKAIQSTLKGALDKIELLHSKVLVALYIAPEKTKGGIIRPDSNVKEDVWQGMVGLVVKKGPIAFVDDDENRFGGANVEVGEWVAFTPGDGRRIQINGVDCRLIEDTQLMLKVNDPSIITHYK